MLILNRYSWWVASMVGLALLLAIMTEVGLLSPFQGIFLRASAPFERVLTGIFSPVASVLSDAGELNDLQDENARLRIVGTDANGIQKSGFSNVFTVYQQRGLMFGWRSLDIGGVGAPGTATFDQGSNSVAVDDRAPMSGAPPMSSISPTHR